jgi:hypothetical protein
MAALRAREIGGGRGEVIAHQAWRDVTPARILIVEDDRVVARDLAQQLTSMVILLPA